MPSRTLFAAVLAVVLASIVLSGCGGSSHPASSSASPSSTSSETSSAPSTTQPTATTPSTTSATATTTNTVSAGPSTTTSTTSSRPPEVPKNKAPKHSKPTAPNTNVRIPAAFVIRSGGAIIPPQIAVPAGVTIELRLSNRDTRAHTVSLSVPHFAAVSVPTGAVRTSEITGARKGTYTLSIDGAAKGKIVVGSVPGP